MDKNKYYCRINGTIHNLSDIQDILDGKSNKNITLVMYEEHGMTDIVDAVTFEEVVRFNNNQIPADYNEALERLQEYNVSLRPKCPTCGSTNIKRDCGFSLYYQSNFRCNNCGYRW